MLTLGLDTSTGWGVLGLILDGEVLAEIGWRVVRNHAEQFISVLAAVSARVNVSPADIDLIAAGRGPGSYTGLRIGLAMAEALSFALGRPVTGVGTLAALAENGAGFPGCVCAAIPARRGEFYAAVFSEGDAIIPPAPFTPGELMARLARLDRPALLLGPGADLLIPHKEVADNLTFGRPEQNLIRGAAVARLGAGNPGEPARPLYLRRTEAEERLEAGTDHGNICRQDGTG